MNIHTEWTWGTHQPLIKAVLDLYDPEFVLELGVGMHSTPIFLERNKLWVGVDNDKSWAQLVSEKHGIPILFQDLGEEITIATPYSSLSKEKQERITAEYKALKIPDLKPNLLFVDQFTCNRMLSINALSDKFDFIIYHDGHPDEVSIVYDYQLIDKTGFNSYALTSIFGTVLMVRKEKDKGFQALLEIILPYIQEFKSKYLTGVDQMELIPIL
jgi:hypothetical protein